jgi:restriction system protein
MRDSEWEEYLVEVFHALGAKAKRIGGAGDQGVDLLVEHSGARIAVQAKGYYHAVSNGAVQEAYAGMCHHGCCACAVITNSRFTKGAHDLAASTGCILIGEDEFPALVMGNFEFCVPQKVTT